MATEKENRAKLHEITKSYCQLNDNLSLNDLIVSKDATIRKLQVNLKIGNNSFFAYFYVTESLLIQTNLM
jgi:hypothetical protein